MDELSIDINVVIDHQLITESILMESNVLEIEVLIP